MQVGWGYPLHTSMGWSKGKGAHLRPGRPGDESLGWGRSGGHVEYSTVQREMGWLSQWAGIDWESRAGLIILSKRSVTAREKNLYRCFYSARGRLEMLGDQN